MKNLLLLLLFIWILPSSLSAQLTTKAGDEAPKITISEYLLNDISRPKLKDKFLVLTLCKSWDQPCFNNLPHFDSLRSVISNDQIVFLNLFRGNPEQARKDIEGDHFDISLATDIYGATQIRYGDGEAGLVGWPLTFLIDDQNVIRWQGGGSDLNTEALERFVNGLYPVIDLSTKYVPLEPDAYLFEPMSPKQLFDYQESDSVSSFVLAWEIDHSLGDLPLDFASSTWSKSLSMGFHAPKTLETIFRDFFPKKRLVVPGDLMDKEYIVAFIQNEIDRETADRVAYSMLEGLGLKYSISEVPAIYYTLEVKNQLKLDAPRKVSIRNILPEGMKDLGGYNDKDLHNFEVRKYDLSGLAQLLNMYTPDRWRYTGNSRKKYNFILDLSSTKALLKSLAQHGLKTEGETGTVEEIVLEPRR